MPAMLDDPSAPTIHRVSGCPPFPDPARPSLPPTVRPRIVTLRDRQTTATVIPFYSRDQVPASLLSYLADQLNREIEGGDTYPMMDPMPAEAFSKYWFQNFGAIMLLGTIDGVDGVAELVAADDDDHHDNDNSGRRRLPRDWSRDCLGSFYIKPNYPGRSSHVCNAGFLVTDGSRNRGVGRLMGESYLDWAPRLGYTYSVFNLVYETNVASCRIWDGLQFKRIGRVKGCGNLRSYPDRLVDAIIYGRELLMPCDDDGGGEDDDGGSAAAAGAANRPIIIKSFSSATGVDGEVVSDERFDKIWFYLKHAKYPVGADRAEKSRLRSAASHYKLHPDSERLMLKDKEVISDPAAQAEIVRTIHARIQHGGINKTTATVAEKYHWSRIKDTVSDVIRSCSECKETTGANNLNNATQAAVASPVLQGEGGGGGGPRRRVPGTGIKTRSARIPKPNTPPPPPPPPHHPFQGANPIPMEIEVESIIPKPSSEQVRARVDDDNTLSLPSQHPHLLAASSDPYTVVQATTPLSPISSTIMPSHTLQSHRSHHHHHRPHHQYHHHPHPHHVVYPPIDPQMIDHNHDHHDFGPFPSSPQDESRSQDNAVAEAAFQALIDATVMGAADDDDDDETKDCCDDDPTARDLEMLI